MSSIFSLITSDSLVDTLKESIGSDITHMTLAFIIAAALHRKWVKKDMREHFKLITESIDNVAKVIGARIDGIDLRLNRLEDKRVATRRKRKR